MIKGIGNVYIQFLGTNKRLLLRNCYYMPELGVNLLSNSELAEDIHTIHTHYNVFIKRGTSILAIREKINGLYYLPIKVINVPPKVYNIAENDHLWHKRFGHIGNQALSKLKDNTISSEDIENIQIKEIDNCEVCLKSKFTKKVYKKSLNKTKYKYLEKIYSDLCGPLRDKTFDNYKYFITFLDKKTKYLEVKLLRTKDEANKAFLEFKNRAENNDSRKRIRIYSTDNGTEFVNKRLRTTLLESGIIHRMF